jgi:hypothetical protein
MSRLVLGKNWHHHYYEMNFVVPPPHPYVKVQTLRISECDCIGDRALKEVTKVK